MELLRQKQKMVKRRREIRAQLEPRPREPFYSALNEELEKLNYEILKSDSVFLELFEKLKADLPLKADGEIDTDRLSEKQKAELSEIKELVSDLRASKNFTK